MYTSTVGRTFLNEYNRREVKNLSAKEFFDKELFTLFFDHPKYMMWPKDSPFVQQVSKSKSGALGLRDRLKDRNGNTLHINKEKIRKIEETKIKLTNDDNVLEFKAKNRSGKNQVYFELLKLLSEDVRKAKLAELEEKLKEGRRDSSVAIGFPALDEKGFATTSGLVTDLNIETDIESVYLSWIGGLMSLGVGAYCLLFDDPEITWATFLGWKQYRRFLNDKTLDKLRANQIMTWNGQWLTYYYSKDYQSDFDFQTLTRKGVFSIDKDKIEVNTSEWSRLFFSLSRHFSDAVKICYVSSLGNTNKTLGFFPFHFKSGQSLVEIYQKLFGSDEYEINRSEFEKLFGKHIKRACELGSVGLQALEPKNITKYFATDANLNLKQPGHSKKKSESDEDYNERIKKIKEKDRENIITFQTYKTWLIAMITKNKEEISDYTQHVAETLVRYREGARKMDRKNLLEKKLFASKRKNDFLEALIEIVQDESVDKEIIQTMKVLRDKVHVMSNEDFVYFALLLKFDYSYQERVSNNN